MKEVRPAAAVIRPKPPPPAKRVPPGSLVLKARQYSTAIIVDGHRYEGQAGGFEVPEALPLGKPIHVVVRQNDKSFDTWVTFEPGDRLIHGPGIVLVPLIAFDRTGHRLGYGAGYYDRTLAGLRQAGPVLAVGLAFDAQEIAEVPPSPNDQRLDAVITERRTLVFAAHTQGLGAE